MGRGLPAIGDVVSVRGCVCLLRVCLSVVVKNFTVNSPRFRPGARGPEVGTRTALRQSSRSSLHCGRPTALRDIHIL